MNRESMYLRWLMALSLGIFILAGNYQVNAQCTNAEKAYESEIYTPDICDGLLHQIAINHTNCGEYVEVELTAGNTYVFSTNYETDFITISDNETNVPFVWGTNSVTFAPSADGIYRFPIHKEANNCDYKDYLLRARYISCSPTPPSDYLYYEGFENGNNVVGQGATFGDWIHENVSGSNKWLVTDNDIEPRTGLWNAYLMYFQKNWMFKYLSLKENTHYTFKMYARSADPDGSNARIKVCYGDEANSSSMTADILSETGITEGGYKLLTGTFMPSATGVYAIGIYGENYSTNGSLSIDDISVEETHTTPYFKLTPDESKDFGEVLLGGASEAKTYTISNNGLGTLDVTNIGLYGTDADQFQFADLNENHVSLEHGESITFRVYFSPDSEGDKAASLDISYNPGGMVNTVSLTGEGLPSLPPGYVCQNPLSLTFPAFAIQGNTDAYGNNYSAADIGIGYDIDAMYMNASEVVYQFTLDVDGYLGGTIFTKGTHIGAFILDDCPNPVDPPIPVYYDVNQDLRMANFWYDPIDAGTYYLIITSRADVLPEFIDEYPNDYAIYLNFYENQPPSQSTFMGDGYWSELEGWGGGPQKLRGGLPGYVSDVRIDGNITVDGQYACKELTIGPEGSITFVGAESKLNILEVPTIESDDTGTGSFIANDDNYIIRENSDNENTVKIERYLTGGWDTNDGGWHQISSPVLDQDIWKFQNNALDFDFYAWGETENLWLNYFDEGWTGGENFNLGQGYLISYLDDENMKEFTGKLNNNSVTKANLSKNGGGWHLLGNPFASALKWEVANWTRTNVSGNAKIWNEAGKTYSDIAANDIIPSAQGFMVQVSDATNSITIPAASRVHDATPYYKSTNEQLLLVAAETEGGSAQESKIIVNSMATEGFDFEFDSRFLAGYGPLLYSVVGDEMLSTNSLPELNSGKVIPFGFVKNTATNFTLELKESIPGRVVYLTDNETATVTNLTESPVYSFTSGEGDDANRFLLAFGTLGINNPEAADGVQVYAYGDVLYVATSAKEAAMINVYNLTGQLVMQGKTGGNTLTTLNASALNNGIYVVNIILNEGVVSRKVVIRK